MKRAITIFAVGLGLAGCGSKTESTTTTSTDATTTTAASTATSADAGSSTTTTTQTTTESALPPGHGATADDAGGAAKSNAAGAAKSDASSATKTETTSTTKTDATTAKTGAAKTEVMPATGTVGERSFDKMTAKFSVPETTKTGYKGVLITLIDDAGKPVEGAVITAKSSMPEHGMDGPDMKSEDKGTGKYWMDGGDMMKGKWRLDMSVKDAAGKSHVDSAEVVLP